MASANCDSYCFREEWKENHDASAQTYDARRATYRNIFSFSYQSTDGVMVTGETICVFFSQIEL